MYTHAKRSRTHVSDPAVHVRVWKRKHTQHVPQQQDSQHDDYSCLTEEEEADSRACCEKEDEEEDPVW